MIEDTLQTLRSHLSDMWLAIRYPLTFYRDQVVGDTRRNDSFIRANLAYLIVVMSIWQWLLKILVGLEFSGVLGTPTASLFSIPIIGELLQSSMYVASAFVFGSLLGYVEIVCLLFDERVSMRDYLFGRINHFIILISAYLTFCLVILIILIPFLLLNITELPRALEIALWVIIGVPITALIVYLVLVCPVVILYREYSLPFWKSALMSVPYLGFSFYLVAQVNKQVSG